MTVRLSAPRSSDTLTDFSESRKDLNLKEEKEEENVCDVVALFSYLLCARSRLALLGSYVSALFSSSEKM